MEGGEVMDYIRNTPGASRTHLVLCVTRGLDYLHSRGVVQGDVKPQNILVNAEGDACLADFGLSIVICNKSSSRGEDRRARGHSSIWVAPETLNEGRISKEVDVFCYSLVALEMFKGESPWGQATASGIMTNITLGKRPDRPKGMEQLGLTTEVWNCLTKCWRQNPEERMTISEVLALLNSTSRTRAETITVRTLSFSKGDTTVGPVTIRARKSTGAPGRTSGSKAYNHQHPGSYVPAQVEASALTEKATTASRPNPAPIKEGKSPGRWKRFVRRCVGIFTLRVPRFPELCCMSDRRM